MHLWCRYPIIMVTAPWPVFRYSAVEKRRTAIIKSWKGGFYTSGGGRKAEWKSLMGRALKTTRAERLGRIQFDQTSLSQLPMWRGRVKSPAISFLWVLQLHNYWSHKVAPVKSRVSTRFFTPSLVQQDNQFSKVAKLQTSQGQNTEYVLAGFWADMKDFFKSDGFILGQTIVHYSIWPTSAWHRFVMKSQNEIGNNQQQKYYIFKN